MSANKDVSSKKRKTVSKKKTAKASSDYTVPSGSDVDTPVDLGGEEAKDAFDVDAETEHTKQALKDCGKHYGDHVDKLKWLTRGWLFCIIILSVIVSTIWLWYPHIFGFDIIALGAAFHDVVGSLPSKTDVFFIYYVGKAVSLVFLLTLLAWCIRMYNHVRRLKIVYKDKEIIGKTLEKFLYSSDTETVGLARQYAVMHLFAPSLDEAERSKKSDTDLEKLLPLLEALNRLSKNIH